CKETLVDIGEFVGFPERLQRVEPLGPRLPSRGYDDQPATLQRDVDRRVGLKADLLKQRLGQRDGGRATGPTKLSSVGQGLVSRAKNNRAAWRSRYWRSSRPRERCRGACAICTRLAAR